MFGSQLDFFGVFRRRERMMTNEDTRRKLKEFERQIVSGKTDISAFFMKKDKLVERIFSKRQWPQAAGRHPWREVLRPAVERMASMGRQDGFKRLAPALSGRQQEEASALFEAPPPEPPSPATETP
ncbi:MAG: hypothetical protein AB7F75_08760 [Planctomycetota bacterium]